MVNFIKSDLFTKLISVIIAVFIWAYVLQENNPVVENWINNISITYLHSEKLKSDGLVVMDGLIQSLSIRAKGKRNILNHLNKSNISATVDLSGITVADEHNLPIHIQFPVDGVEISQKQPAAISLTVDNIVSVEKEVTAHPIGSPANNYSLLHPKLEPSLVAITGPESILSTISRVIAPVRVSGIKRGVSEVCPLTMVDEAGEEIVNGNLSMDISSVNVSYSVLLTKTVPVYSIMEGTTRNTQRVVRMGAINPFTIRIYGSPEIIEDVSSIRTKAINVTGINSNTTVSADLIIPEGVNIENGLSTVSVSLTASPTPTPQPDDEQPPAQENVETFIQEEPLGGTPTPPEPTATPSADPSVPPSPTPTPTPTVSPADSAAPTSPPPSPSSLPDE